MKADFEPWWQFEGWESNIVETQSFKTEEELNAALEEVLQKFRSTYENEASKDIKYYAFWNEEECEYCEACDDNSQIYHGIIIEKPIHNIND